MGRANGLRCAALATVMALIALSAPAVAQTSGMSAEDEAHMRFDTGRRYYEAGRFADAAREFEESYRIAPHDELLYNLYLAYRDSGDDAHAAETLRHFLSTSMADDRRAQLEARLAVMEQRLAATHPEVASTTTTTTQTVSQEPEATAVAAPPVEPSAGSGGGMGPTPWIVIGVGAALLVGSIVTGVLALDARSSLDAMCPTTTTCADGYEDTRSRGQILAGTTDALWAVGGAVALTGIVLAIVDATSSHVSDTPTAAATCDPHGCTLTVRGSF